MRTTRGQEPVKKDPQAHADKVPQGAETQIALTKTGGGPGGGGGAWTRGGGVWHVWRGSVSDDQWPRVGTQSRSEVVVRDCMCVPVTVCVGYNIQAGVSRPSY